MQIIEHLPMNGPPPPAPVVPRPRPPIGSCPSCDTPFSGMNRRCRVCSPYTGRRRKGGGPQGKPTEPTATPGRPVAETTEPAPADALVVGPWLARELEAAQGVVEAVSGLDRGAVARIFNYVTSALAPPGEPR
jgi:hypothetical protein